MLQADLGLPIQDTRCKERGNVVTLIRKATTSALAPKMESSQMYKAGAKYVANQKEVRMRGGIKLTILFPSPQLKATEDKERKTRVGEASNEDLQFHSPNFGLAVHPHQDWDQGHPDATEDEKRKPNTLKNLGHFYPQFYPMSQVDESLLTKNFVNKEKRTKEGVHKMGPYVVSTSEKSSQPKLKVKTPMKQHREGSRP